MTIDEAIALLKFDNKHIADLENDDLQQLAELLEKLKTVENIMLIYNANWYADEDNGVPDCEVLESIWNVIQGNGLDIDIEQDYRKGKADGYNKGIDDFVKFANTMPTVEAEDGEVRPMWLEEMAEQLKVGGDNE